MSRLLIALSVVALFLTNPIVGRGDDPKAPAAGFDDKAFGRLPILFNGRVTDFDHFARNALTRISEQETWLDADGKSHAAIAWLLDLICANDVARAARIISIPGPHVRKLFELETKARRVSLQELLPRLTEFRQREAEIMKSQARRTPEEQEILGFADRLDFLSRLMAVFRLPDLTSQETIVASLRLDQDAEGQAIPFVVPPIEPGGNWQTLVHGLVQAHVAKVSDFKANPCAILFDKLMTARTDKNVLAFNQTVAELAAVVKGKGLAVCPYDFKVPRGWLEQGTPRLGDPYYFGDAQAHGTTVTTLYYFDHNESLSIHVNYFPRGAAAKEKPINSWRLSHGMTPLPTNAIQTTPVTVAGQPGWRVDLETPENLPARLNRMLAVGVSLGDHSLIITCSGSKALMAGQIAAFDQFVASMTASPAELETWFALREPKPAPPSGASLILALIPDNRLVWKVQVYCENKEASAQQEQLTTILKSIRFRPRGKGTAAADQLPFTWTLPEGWELEESVDGRFRTVTRTPSEGVGIDLEPIQTSGDLWRTPFINQLRMNLQLPELSSEKIAENLMTLKVDGRSIDIVVMELP